MVQFDSITNKVRYIEQSPEYDKSLEITINELRKLKSGMNIKVIDNSYTRLQYVLLGGEINSIIYPGNYYIIEDINIGENDAIIIIKHHGIYGHNWFETINNK
ncbi:hypothetical protein J4216_06800 [Candidatus Woesearchaeota archaeon]|nr:hypothetical protein [Candidatus Woesearchaeota archaeon]